MKGSVKKPKAWYCGVGLESPTKKADGRQWGQCTLSCGENLRIGPGEKQAWQHEVQSPEEDPGEATSEAVASEAAGTARF